MKKVIILISLVALVLLLSCSPSISTQEVVMVDSSSEPVLIEVPAPDVIIEEPIAEIQTAPINLSCTLTIDCEEGKQCINGQCGTIGQLYQTDCEQKCNFEEVIVSTSDGDTYTLGKGQGSYTAAGVLEWKLISVPNYCPLEKVIVPIRIIAKNYSKIVGEYALTLQEGETSERIIHPAIPSVEFTVTVDKVKEKCE